VGYFTETLGGSPYVDLRLAPYFIVAGIPAAAAANTAAINRAITTFSGTGAALVLPAGAVYLDKVVGKIHSIVFADGISQVALRGQGMFATQLVQQGDGGSAEWDCVVLDGCSRVEIADLSISQGTITNPSGTQQNSLLGIYANVLNNPAGNTQDISIHHVAFGQCYGDQIRIVGDGTGTKLVDTVKIQHVIMRGQGLGLGARSAISFQRGHRCIEFCDFYIEGVKNNSIDMEPSGSTEMGTVQIHHGVINNSLGQVATAVFLGGNDSTNSRRSQLDHVIVLEGFVEVFDADGWDISDLQVYTSGGGPSATSDAMLYLFHRNVSTCLRNVRLTRDTGATAGPLVMIQNSGTNFPTRVTFDGGEWLTRVGPGAGLAYVDIQSADKTQIRGVRLRVEDPTPTSNYGMKFRTVGGDITATQITDCQIESTSGKLLGGIWLVATNGHAIGGVQVCDVSAPNACTSGVIMDVQGGTSFEPYPIVQGCDWTGTTSAIVIVNSAVGVVFPVIAGSKGGVVTLFGTVAPTTVVSAAAGSTYVKSTGEVYISAGGTTWAQLTIP
jgi:hypothetical protein